MKPALWDLSQALQVSQQHLLRPRRAGARADRYLDYARRFGFCVGLRIGSDGRGLPVDPSYVSAQADGGCAPVRRRRRAGQRRLRAGPRSRSRRSRWRCWRRRSPTAGWCPQPYVVRDLRTHAATPADGPTADVLETYGGGRGSPAISSQAAAQVAPAMVDAVEGPIGRLYAGAGAVSRYRGRRASRRPARPGPPSVAPAWRRTPGSSASRRPRTAPLPTIAIAVIVEGGGTGSGHAAPIGGAVMAEWLKLSGRRLTAGSVNHTVTGWGIVRLRACRLRPELRGAST